ncbi:MAG: META domain-containing protein [Treponema sp.]|nr:META domain-containing protein [Treponema sp.]
MKLASVCVLVPLVWILASCAGTAPAAETAGREIVKFSEIKGKMWQLSAVKTGPQTIDLDRQVLTAQGMGDIYTLTFNEDILTGKAAPNLYYGPYKAGTGNVLSIGNMAGTLMAAIWELDGLKEQEFFDYLSRVTSWTAAAGRLELHTSNAAGETAILVFTAL